MLRFLEAFRPEVKQTPEVWNPSLAAQIISLFHDLDREIEQFEDDPDKVIKGKKAYFHTKTDEYVLPRHEVRKTLELVAMQWLVNIPQEVEFQESVPGDSTTEFVQLYAGNDVWLRAEKKGKDFYCSLHPQPKEGKRIPDEREHLTRWPIAQVDSDQVIQTERDKRFDVVQENVEDAKRELRAIQNNEDAAYQVFIDKPQNGYTFLLTDLTPEQLAYNLSFSRQIGYTKEISKQLQQLQTDTQSWQKVWVHTPLTGSGRAVAIEQGRQKLEAKPVRFALGPNLNLLFYPQYTHRIKDNLYYLSGYKIVPEVIDFDGSLTERTKREKQKAEDVQLLRQQFINPQSYVNYFTNDLDLRLLKPESGYTINNSYGPITLSYPELLRLMHDFFADPEVVKKYKIEYRVNGNEIPKKVQLCEKNVLRINFIFTFQPDQQVFTVAAHPTQELVDSVRQQRRVRNVMYRESEPNFPPLGDIL